MGLSSSSPKGRLNAGNLYAAHVMHSTNKPQWFMNEIIISFLGFTPSVTQMLERNIKMPLITWHAHNLWWTNNTVMKWRRGKKIWSTFQKIIIHVSSCFTDMLQFVKSKPTQPTQQDSSQKIIDYNITLY